MRISKSGFTIVELLIVVVVIAILAAISVVAYNGIQTRARNSQVISGVNTYYKALLSYQAVNSTLPQVSGFSCLGAGYPSNSCWQQNSSPTVTVNATLDNLLTEYIPQKPTLATNLMAMNSVDSRAGLAYLYGHPSAGLVELRYYLQGNGQSCNINQFTATNEGNLTNCYLRLAVP